MWARPVQQAAGIRMAALHNLIIKVRISPDRILHLVCNAVCAACPLPFQLFQFPVQFTAISVCRQCACGLFCLPYNALLVPFYNTPARYPFFTGLFPIALNALPRNGNLYRIVRLRLWCIFFLFLCADRPTGTAQGSVMWRMKIQRRVLAK